MRLVAITSASKPSIARRKQRLAKVRWSLQSGEVGIGKSRLPAALLERLANEPHTRLRYFYSPQHTDSALYPIISQTERAGGLPRDDHSANEARQT
jgi:predicted ATPase